LPPPRARGARLRRPARRRSPRPHPRSARARGRRARPGARPHDDGGDGGAELRGVRARLHPPPGARRPGGRLDRRHGLDRGAARRGRRRSPRGRVILARPAYQRWWQDRSANRFHVTLAPGASLDAVRHAIATQVGGAQGLKVLTQRELYTYHRDAVRRAFRLTDALEILPLVVAALGLAEALLAVSLDRRREFALLRAAGATRAQVARAVVGESAGVGALGLAGGLGIGLVLAFIWVRVNFTYQLGWEIDFHFAAGSVPAAAAAALLVSVPAGLFPARRVARLPVLEALRAE